MRRGLSWAAGTVIFFGFFMTCRHFTYSIFFAQNAPFFSDWFPMIVGTTLLILLHALLTVVLVTGMTDKHFLVKQVALLAVVVFTRLFTMLYSFDAGVPFGDQFALQCLRNLPSTLCVHLTIQAVTLFAMGKLNVQTATKKYGQV